MPKIIAEISVGELLDKITILRIKSERISDPEKKNNVRKELEVLEKTRKESLFSSRSIDSLFESLKEVNERLWVIEDHLRQLESKKQFDQEFVDLARSVYIENDLRSKLKREINLLSGSSLIEEKEYVSYSDY